jgi:hypothetical protein
MQAQQSIATTPSQTKITAILFLGGNDVVDDHLHCIRQAAVEPFIDQVKIIFETRSRTPEHIRNTPLIWILLLPHHVKSAPQVTRDIRIINRRIQSIIKKIRFTTKTQLWWVDPSGLIDPAYYDPKQIHLTTAGRNALLETVQRDTKGYEDLT